MLESMGGMRLPMLASVSVLGPLTRQPSRTCKEECSMRTIKIDDAQYGDNMYHLKVS